MTRTTKADRLEAAEYLKEALADCGPKGDSTLLILNVETKPSSSGCTHYIEIRTIAHEGHTPHGEPSNNRPRVALWLTRNAARACGFTYSEKREQILMGGYGYSRSHQICDHLVALAGHALYVQTLGEGIGDTNGWFYTREERNQLEAKRQAEREAANKRFKRRAARRAKRSA